jgi:hypothetical protein
MAKTEYVRFEVCDFHGISRSKLVPARNKDSKVFLYAGELNSSALATGIAAVLTTDTCDAPPTPRRPHFLAPSILRAQACKGLGHAAPRWRSATASPCLTR